MPAVTNSSLTPPRRELVRLMQQINFGRLEGLHVRAGEPVLSNPAPRIVREVKFCSENGPRSESLMHDFMLKAQVVELLAELDRVGDGIIDLLTVKHGLPFAMHVAARP